MAFEIRHLLLGFLVFALIFTGFVSLSSDLNENYGTGEIVNDTTAGEYLTRVDTISHKLQGNIQTSDVAASGSVGLLSQAVIGGKIVANLFSTLIIDIPALALFGISDVMNTLGIGAAGVFIGAAVSITILFALMRFLFGREPGQ